MKKFLIILLTISIFLACAPSVAAMGLFIPIKGDADADGSVTASDARLILRTSVGLHIPFILRRSLYDCDNDGKITAADARRALRAAVGLEDLTNEKAQSREEAIKELADTVSQTRLQTLMNEICAIGTRSVLYPKNNLAAQEYISQRLRECGVNFKKQSFTYNGIETANIVEAGRILPIRLFFAP